MKNLRIFWFLLSVLFFTGCSSPVKQNNEWVGMSLDEFISKQELKILKGIPYIYLGIATKIKGISNVSDEKRVAKNFSDWCVGSSGYIKVISISSVAKGEKLIYLNALHNYLTDKAMGSIMGYGGLECFDSIGQPLAFYAPDQMSKVNGQSYAVFFDGAEMVLLLEKEKELRNKKIALEKLEEEKRNKLRQQWFECRIDASILMRSQIQPGTFTMQGMVVEVKRPLANVQKDQGLTWYRIEDLQSPLSTCGRQP